MSPSSNASLSKFRESEDQEFPEDIQNEEISITGQSEVDTVIQSFFEHTLSSIDIQTKDFAPAANTPTAGKEIRIIESQFRLELSRMRDNSHQEDIKPLETFATKIEALMLLEKHILHWGRALRNATLSANDIKMLLRDNLEKIVPAEITPNANVQEQLDIHIRQLLIKIIMNNDEMEE